VFRYILAAMGCLAVLTGCSGAPTKAPDPRDATYTIGEDTITLTDGRYEAAAAPGSASKRVVTLLPEKTATGDLNGDGITDTAVILVDQPGGSGSFYYLAALPGPATDKPVSLPAVLLGDRIIVDTVTIACQKVTVDYLDRKLSEPMSAPPSVKVTKAFTIKDGELRQTLPSGDCVP
jgi:hypothetical protein